MVNQRTGAFKNIIPLSAFFVLYFIGQAAAHLQVLDLGNNQLSSIEVRSFRGLESLVHLDLSDNSIVDVADGAFNGLRRLTRLDLRDNRIARLTASTLRGLTALRYLLLTNNRIETVDRRALRSLEALVYIVLKGNPIGGQPVRFQVSISRRLGTAIPEFRIQGFRTHLHSRDPGIERPVP